MFERYTQHDLTGKLERSIFIIKNEHISDKNVDNTKSVNAETESYI